MLKDECILVDENDNITGHANKYNSHRWGWVGTVAVAQGFPGPRSEGAALALAVRGSCA